MSYFRQLFFPAAVFQGVIIGGGYATGREVMEYVSRHGFVGGVFAVVAIALVFSAVLGITFALAVQTSSFDYRSFLRVLLGRWWVAYEILFVALLILVLSIVGAAAGEALGQGFGVSYHIGVAVLLAAVSILNFFGRETVQSTLVVFTVALMIALSTLLVSLVASPPAGSAINSYQPDSSTTVGALGSGVQFAIYNSALVPVLLYCVRDIRGTGLAFKAGVVAGLGGVLPAAMLHVAFMYGGDTIVTAPLPTLALLEFAAAGQWTYVYYFLLFATLLLTAVGVLQGVIERVDAWRLESDRAALSRASHGIIAGVLVVASLSLAGFGIIC